MQKSNENLHPLEELKKFKMENEKFNRENSGIEKIFSEGQRRHIQNKKIMHWGANNIGSAISLNSAGARAYRRLVKNNFPFPAESTLRR